MNKVQRFLVFAFVGCGLLFGGYVLGGIAEKDRLEKQAIKAGVDPRFSHSSCMALFD